jgi:D-methionine transport system ATP-binding protein
MISIEHVSKTYHNKTGDVLALNDVSLQVEKGDIYGVIGHSGSGKSTLIRCVNRLEPIDSGTIIVGGSDISTLSENELRQKRQKMGMIFQHFNLLRNDNVYSNVAMPLKYTGAKHEEVVRKTDHLLELVGLTDKKNSYPSQLSGGQKQRVAIARALANDPEILLCDEATSALDPETTHSILSLLKELNERLNLTILIITHEMTVIKDICSNVAVLSDGQIVEQGGTLDVFTKPRHAVTQQFTKNPFEQDKLDAVLLGEYVQKALNAGGIVAKLIFKGESANEALLSDISRRFDISASVFFGNIEIIQSQPVGNLYVAMNGDPAKLQDAIRYIEAQPYVIYDPISDSGIAEGGGNENE